MFVISAHGLEPIDVGGQSVTATHYSLVNGADRREFWVDADGRVLRVEIPSSGSRPSRRTAQKALNADRSGVQKRTASESNLARLRSSCS